MIKKAILLIFVLTFASSFGQIVHKRKLSMLGSPFEVTVVAPDTIKANEYIDLAVAEVKRIENQISDWIPTTPISQVNKNAGIQPVKVDDEVFQLVTRANKISKLTNGGGVVWAKHIGVSLDDEGRSITPILYFLPLALFSV